MKLWLKMDIGQNPPGKPPPRGATYIIKNGLDQYVRVSQKEATDNGPGSV